MGLLTSLPKIKINIIKLITNNSPQYASNIGYNGKYIEE
jgi:hypothetical protein